MIQTSAQNAATRLLDYDTPQIAGLIRDRGWADLSRHAQIGATYDFVRNEIAFGYNRADDLRASEVLEDGYGQCNTKGTLFMALLRGLAIPCRLHGFTIHKALQRGVIPELIYPLAPAEILHSWVEVETEDGWVNLEGFILDAPFLQTLQQEFDGVESLCGYGAGTGCLSAPPVEWTGSDTYIQKSGITRDLGPFDSPDEFYHKHHQKLGFLREWLYRHVIRHWMNARVRAIRKGNVPRWPRRSLPNHHHDEKTDTTTT